jgi:Chromosome segregation ATPases
LRLDSLDSRQVKEYLLEIYKNDLHDRSVNFKEEWDKSFADVNYDKSQFDAVTRNLERIKAMESQHQARLVLRGKLIHSRPLVEQGLIDWESYFTRESQRLQTEAHVLEEQFNTLETRQRTLFEELAQARSDQKELNKLQQRQQELELQFQFVQDLAQLETQFAVLQDQRDELKLRLKNAEHQQNAANLKRKIENCSREIRQLEQRIAAIDDNLYLQLQSVLPAESFNALIRLLAPSVLSSTVAVHDQQALRALDTALTEYLNGSCNSRLPV